MRNLAHCWICAVLLAGPAATGGVSGKFDYYVLALSWSPSYCIGEGRSDRSPQCSGTRPYAFVLHGLWPQYEKGWPETCETGGKPWVSSQTIGSMLDIMPSRGLILHQYRKHGTCSGLQPDAYFAAAKKAFSSIAIPPRYLNPEKPVVISPKEIENDFIKANSGLSTDMISVTCGHGNRLGEIRICLSRQLQFRPCGLNEEQSRLCRSEKIMMPPVRSR